MAESSVLSVWSLWPQPWHRCRIVFAASCRCTYPVNSNNMLCAMTEPGVNFFCGCLHEAGNGWTACESTWLLQHHSACLTSPLCHTCCSVLQVPLISLTENLRKRLKSETWGNYIFWVTFCMVGQPMSLLMYYHDYVYANADHGKQALTGAAAGGDYLRDA